MKLNINYPFDSEYILRNKKRIKRELLSSEKSFLDKRVAILGGSTTSEIKNILELFLLNYGIKPEFYESEYNKFYEDAVFGNETLLQFDPDIVFIHTSAANILNYPTITDDYSLVSKKLETEFNRFYKIWESIRNQFNCVIIQNNFEYPQYRILGNKDATDTRGRVNFITRLNLEFAEYAENNKNFFINDINYLSAQYGLEKWSDLSYWYLYKYSLSISAIPTLAYSVSKIIKAVYGKNKKAYVLDLDNTLWGGVVGDDGVVNLEIGPETARGEAFAEFQEYLKAYKDLGVLLNINSKNDIENALAGLEHPANILRKNDFIEIKANWNPKSQNLLDISESLNIGTDSIVFVDDNPAEREIINQNLPDVATPDIGDAPENFIKILDRNGYFECVNISNDDFKKTEMYLQNIKRTSSQKEFGNYSDYLVSLDMEAEILPFDKLYLQRIAQLTNKSNQFNLTTKRYSLADIEHIYNNDEYIAIYGRLKDKFGDNGIVSVVIGRIDNNNLEIELWLMSCRVLKRDFEYAMMDVLVEKARDNRIDNIFGYYYPTAKNKMVRDFYGSVGFIKVNEDDSGNTKWSIKVTNYHNQNKYIKVED